MESGPVDSTDPVSQSTQTVVAEKVSLVGPGYRPPLLPDSFKHPFVLIWVAILPQLILLLLNLRDYQLVSGEMTSWQRWMSAIIRNAEIALLLTTAALVVITRALKRLLPWAACWVLLVAPILYLWLVVYQIGFVLPASVTTWILPEEPVLYDQFAFIMPLIFYAAIRLACVDLNISRVVDYVTCSAIAIGVPLFFFGLMQVRYPWLVLAHLPWFVLMAIFVIATVAMIGALLRVLVTVYLALRKKGPIALGILSFLVGIAGPIGGLLLNRSVPFPADFQALPVYAMAAVNGALLLLPNFRHPLFHRVVWLSQCVFFPFTFYFFLVFLPFLPLSIVAILMAGAGFLVLTPTALFLVHGQRIFDGYRDEIRDGGRLKPAILALVALSIFPAFYASEAVIDRIVLRQAIDYVYSPNYRTDTRFTGNTAVVRHSLLHLRDFKAGLELPFLSRFYNWVVFDGLVLPDEKMNHIYRAFFGQDLPQSPPGAIGLFGNTPRRQSLFHETRTVPPPHGVRLLNATATVAVEGNCSRATVLLEMYNSSPTQSELVTSIHLDEGVLISGFWLHMGDQRVPGQLFEKKTALWVYQMIRDRTRRDPGLLLYTDPQILELRVFPFAGYEERQVEIELLYPTTLKPAIRIGRETVHPSGDGPPAGVVLTHSDQGSMALVAPIVLSGLPASKRTPYLHFIVDRSTGSHLTNYSFAEVIRAARAQVPEASECLVTVANYETADLRSELTPMDSLAAIDLQSLPQRGGFLPERAIKRTLLRYHDALNEGATNNPWLVKFPVLIVVSDDHTTPISEKDLSTFAEFVPDIAGYYVTTDTGALEAKTFKGESVTGLHPVKPVTLLKLGNSIAPLATGEARTKLIAFDASQQDELTAFDPTKHAFVAVAPTEKIPAQSRYSAGIAAWQDYLALIYNPSLGSAGLAQSVKRSRESGVLVASTSYIVVENSAQWKVLERKQNQKLRNSVALEVEAVPEPSTWCLLALGGMFLIFFLARERSTSARADVKLLKLLKR